MLHVVDSEAVDLAVDAKLRRRQEALLPVPEADAFRRQQPNDDLRQSE
jgi:hypothetical protein